jgi:hypothetical protein
VEGSGLAFMQRLHLKPACPVPRSTTLRTDPMHSATPALDEFRGREASACWPVSVALAACGRRASCRAPRWGETRSLFPNKQSSRGRVGRGLARGPLQAWRACARCGANSERGPAARYPSNFDRAPAEPGRPGRGSAGHVTARQAPAHPAASDTAPRNASRESGWQQRRRQAAHHARAASRELTPSAHAAASAPRSSGRASRTSAPCR